MTTFNEALAQTKPQLDAATAAAVAALAAADAAHEAYQQFTKAHPAATATAAESQTARQLHLAAENASIALAAADVHQDAMTSTYNAILSSVSAGKGNDPVPLAAEATLSPPVTPLITAPSPPAEVAPASDPGIESGFAFGAGADLISQQVAVAEQATELAAQNPVIEGQQPAGYETGFAIGPGAETINEQVAVAEQTSALAAQNVDPAAQAAALNEQVAALSLQNPIGLTVAKAETAGAPTKQDTITPKGDWRVRLSLAPGSNYLYKAKNAEGILLPLLATDGVIFPYTPNIIVSYAAHYDPAELTHSNYKIFQYKNSSVDTITITCEFTAQDTAEANYLLAVIHFFKSVTKMFYGKDENPMRGTPPPLCYLTGLGQFQFDQHPLAITTFNYTLPTDVDYVRANSTGTSVAGGATPTGGDGGYPDASKQRQLAAALQAGGGPAPPNFNFTAATNTQATYVPTKMQISITAVPIVSRGDISKEFSLKKYATGALLQGSKRQGGGIW